MLTNTGKNIKLTVEQTLQLEEWQRRLSVLQGEIKEGKKELATVTAEVDKKAAEKIVLEQSTELLSLEEKQLSNLKKERQVEVDASKEELNKHVEERNAGIAVLDSKSSLHTKKEKELGELSLSLSNREKLLAEGEKKLSEQQLLVEEARKAFLKAAESIKWK